MARSVNKVILVGNLGTDPEVRTTASGTKVARLSLATNRQWKDENGQVQERTEWHRVSLWAGLADIAEQWLKKGDRVYVEGRIEYSDNGKEGEERRIFTNIVARELFILGSGNGAGANNEGGNNGRKATPAPAPTIPDDEEFEDDLPF